jgi:hypothetical protein
MEQKAVKIEEVKLLTTNGFVEYGEGEEYCLGAMEKEW